MSKTIFILSFIFCFAVYAWSTQVQVIYGSDDRLDFYEIIDPNLRQVALSTGAILPRNLLQQEKDQSWSFYARAFGDKFRLCPEERFRNQPALSSCSGFLLTDQILVTAGHCFSPQFCGDFAIVFDYALLHSQHQIIKFNSEQIYFCQQVLERQVTPEQDYMFILLDRPVNTTWRFPLRLQSKISQVGDEVTAIGYPAGLPLKVSGGGIVRRSEASFFVAGLDTYHASSGSAVVNSKTLEVVGVLVRGEQDYQYDFEAQCNRSRRCHDFGCRGEDVTHGFYLIDALERVMSRSRIEQ